MKLLARVKDSLFRTVRAIEAARMRQAQQAIDAHLRMYVALPATARGKRNNRGAAGR